MGRWSWGIATFCAVLALGCGGDDGSSDDDVVDPADGGIECGATCADLGATCGSFTDPCGETIDCGLCRYDAYDVPTTYAGRPVIVDGDPVMIAHANIQESEIEVAVLGDDGWTLESAAPFDSFDEDSAIDFAVRGDQRWVAFLDDDVARVAHSIAGGPWEVETLAGVDLAYGIAVAIDEDGAVVVAASEAATALDGPVGIYAFERTDDGWEATLVREQSGGPPTRASRIATTGATRHIVWTKDNTLQYATGGADGYAVEALSPGASSDAEAFPFDVYADAAGDLHLTFANGTGASYRKRVGDGWEELEITSPFSDRANALSVDAQGTLRIAYFNFAALAMADRIAAGFTEQIISGECDEGDVDMALGQGGQVRLVYRCGNVLHYLARSGAYPDGYAEACAQLVDDVCATACSTCAADDGDCCVKTPGSQSCTSEFGCTGNTYARLCGDASQAPELVYDCAAAAAADELACAIDGAGVDLTTEPCLALFQ